VTPLLARNTKAITLSQHSIVMQLRKSNKEAHPGLPDLPSRQHRTSQQVTEERKAKMLVLTKRNKVLKKYHKELAQFKKYRNEIAAKTDLPPEPTAPLTKVPQPQIQSGTQPAIPAKEIGCNGEYQAPVLARQHGTE